MIPYYLSGITYESSQFEDVLIHAEQNLANKTLVVCDIDNTLLKGAQHLGSETWSEHLIAELESKGVLKHHAEQIETILWHTVQPRIKVECVDSKTSQTLQKIQVKEIAVLALTARTLPGVEYTFDQLLSVEINLLDGLQPFANEYRILEPYYNVAYDKGILFCSNNKKSEVLFTFLEKENYYPECIIFIDDKWKHVKDLEQACAKRNIDYIGIRFSAADEYVKNYDPFLADIQWRAFPEILSDEQARKKTKIE